MTEEIIPKPAEAGAPPPTPKEVASLALNCLQTFVHLAGLDATVSTGSIADDEVIMEMTGPDAAILIGRHGQTLDALQYILLVMISSRRPLPPQFRLTVDVEGYRQRRTEALCRYALSLAAQVKQTGEEAVLEPLNPHERRIVHTALMDDPAVETYSEGQGADRHIVISPVPAGTPRRQPEAS